jgi:hypothetical protein
MFSINAPPDGFTLRQPPPCKGVVMRREAILVAAAALFGLAGGYAWMAMTAEPAPGPRPAKAAMMAIPPSPEEQPAVLDREWTERADDQNASATADSNAASPVKDSNAS